MPYPLSRCDYTLVIVSGKTVTHLENLTLADLARECFAAFKASPFDYTYVDNSVPLPWPFPWYDPSEDFPVFELIACSGRGRPLNALTLLRAERRRLKAALSNRQLVRRHPFWNGDGPVPGAGRNRYRRYRHPRTQQARREALSPLDSEAPGPRAARRACHLPATWDDVRRIYTQSWKGQHKGRKAWDRGR